MADDRTQDALDALADLFLTGLEPVETARQSAAATRTPPSPAAAPRGDDGLDGPSPIRLAPKVTPRRTRHEDGAESGKALGDEGFHPATGYDDFDASAPEPAFPPHENDESDDKPFLRLRREEESAAGGVVAIAPAKPGAGRDFAEITDATDPDGGAAARAPVERQPLPVLVEAVLLGNLPGVGAPWLTQYAQLLATGDESAVAVLHVGDDAIELELVEPSESAQRAPLSLDTPHLAEALDTLARRESSPLRTVLVHLDAEGPDAQKLMAVGHWAMLAGADDAAIVSVYRTLKRLVEADAAAAAKRVGLAVMGSDETPSRAAYDRVRAAAESFLHTPVQFVGCQKKLGPANVRQIGAFEGADVQWSRLVQWFDSLAAPEFDEVAPPAPRPAVSPKPQPSAARPPVKPRPSIFDAPLPKRRTAALRPSTPTRPISTARPAPAPRVSEPVAAQSPAPVVGGPRAKRESGVPDLAALVSVGPRGIAGGIALDARCPHHPDTQLLLDQTGRLHLLRRALPSDAGALNGAGDPDVATLRAAIVDLLEARAWVRQHVELLRLTQRQLRIDADAPPGLHLFTHRADLATGLIARLGETLRLHLLHEVRVGDEATWFCTPLS